MRNLSGFEFRLSEPEPSADFGPDVSGLCPLARWYIEQGRAAPAGSRAAALGAFMSQMSDDAWPSSALLEYDVYGVPDDERPDPGLYLSVVNHPAIAGVPAAGDAVGIIADALGLPRDDDERQSVERLCEALPDGGFVNLIGAMPDRGIRAVRVQVDGIDAAQVPGLLSRIGWSGPIRLVEETLADMLTVAKGFSLAFDVAAEGPLPHVGVEIGPLQGGITSFDGWLRTVRRDWQPLIEHLMDTGLCLRPKGEALIAFPGRSQIDTRMGALIVYRAIAGLKIAVSHSGRPSKGYGFTVVFQAS